MINDFLLPDDGFSQLSLDPLTAFLKPLKSGFLFLVFSRLLNDEGFGGYYWSLFGSRCREDGYFCLGFVFWVGFANKVSGS